jgi:hypothetical protein
MSDMAACDVIALVHQIESVRCKTTGLHRTVVF